MTQSPDYEYNITEKEMLDLGNCISSEKGHWILKTVRSRKHSPPSGRDKVLDTLTLIELWICDYQMKNGNGEIDPEQLREMLESIRTPAPEAKK